MTVSLAFGWRHLLFANWPVAPETIDPHLPAALSVDTHEGDGWLSVVALRNVDTRPRRLPAALGIDIPEVNLRTYVTVDGEPGVYFFSLDVPSLSTVLGARLTHFLPYYYGSVDLSASGGRLAVDSRRRHPGARSARFAAVCDPGDVEEAFTAEPGSLAAFLAERRRLYTEGPDGSLRHTDVSHPRWRLFPATVDVTANTLFRASGFDVPETAPRCYYSPGVDVTTTGSRLWAGVHREESTRRSPRTRIQPE